MSQAEQLSMKADELLDALFKVNCSVSREKAIKLFSKILSKIESCPRFPDLNHAKIVQKFRSLRCPFMVELLVVAGFTRIFGLTPEHDRLRLTNNNVAFVSQKLAAKIEAHDAELKLHFILCLNKQRLAVGEQPIRCAVKKEVPTKDTKAEVNPLTSEMLQDAKPAEKKRMIGERLFRKIQAVEPRLAGKITKKLLDLDNTELLLLLSDQRALMIWVNEALRVLKDYQQKQEQRKQLWKQQMQRQLRNKKAAVEAANAKAAKQGFFDVE